MRKIKVVVKEPGKAPEERKIRDTLEDLQELVCGFIEAVYFAEGVVMLVNEDGKNARLMPNFPLWNDIICGTAVFVGHEGDDFADCPMSAEEIQKILKNGPEAEDGQNENS